MKKHLLCLLLPMLVLALSVSCSKDDESPSYNFKNQDASGKINNVDFTYEDGYAEVTDKIRIRLTIQQSAPACDIIFPEGDMVFFTVGNTVQLYPLSFGDEDSYSVTLLEVDEFMNWIAVEGAVEITSISDTEVSGRIDARADTHTYINGNFTVPICQ